MVTLKELKKILYKNTLKVDAIPFLTTFLPDMLCNNPDGNLNIHLINSHYQDIAGWLSHLMNGKTSSNDKKATKSGVERVRKQMLSIILENENLIYDIETNFKDFTEQFPIDLQDLQYLIDDDSQMDEDLKSHFYKCLHKHMPHGLTLLFLYGLFPNHIQKLTHLKSWKTPNCLPKLSKKSKTYSIVLNLQQKLNNLIYTIRETCGLGEESDDCCLNQISEFESLLQYYRLEIPDYIYNHFCDIFKSINDIYYHLYHLPNTNCTYATLLAYDLQQIVKLEESYHSFCQDLNEIFTDIH